MLTQYRVRYQVTNASQVDFIKEAKKLDELIKSYD